MPEHPGGEAKPKSTGSLKGENVVEGLAMGMHELVHKCGVGAVQEAPGVIGHLFGVEGGGGHGGGSEKHR
ncbi:MAG: hypothetical protein AAB729_04835 [Patescibacteria group bacterium]